MSEEAAKHDSKQDNLVGKSFGGEGIKITRFDFSDITGIKTMLESIGIADRCAAFAARLRSFRAGFW